MDFHENDFVEGVRLGIGRARLKLENRRLMLSTQGQRLIRGSLDRYPSELNGRFVQLFVELATLAIVTRSEYGEPELTNAELDQFLDYSTSFFNSFRHRVVEAVSKPDEVSEPDSGVPSPVLAQS